jgi:hypothetical protein
MTQVNARVSPFPLLVQSPLKKLSFALLHLLSVLHTSAALAELGEPFKVQYSQSCEVAKSMQVCTVGCVLHFSRSVQ